MLGLRHFSRRDLNSLVKKSGTFASCLGIETSLAKEERERRSESKRRMNELKQRFYGEGEGRGTIDEGVRSCRLSVDLKINL